MTEEHKCKDCKWLTGKKNIRGIECMNPVLQEKWNGAKNLWMGELRKDSARYKQGSALACKKFEAKESEHMGRYIDADALHDALKAKQKWVVRCGDKHNEGYTYDQVHFAIDDAPSIDIVRCKECIERDDDWCMYWQNVINPDDFCSYGERKESER